MQHLLSVLHSNPALAGNESLRIVINELAKQVSSDGAATGLDVYICSYGDGCLLLGKIVRLVCMHPFAELSMFPAHCQVVLAPLSYPTL